MSHLNPGLFAAYNSLTDKHLSGYFNNVRIRRHLQKVGLITRSGRIVPDKEYKHKLIQRAHQKHVRECLAQAIFHKVLDMERLHQTEIKRKLEEFAQRERIHKMKVERSRRCDDEPMLMLSPRPPTRPKISQARHSGPEGDNSESTESLGSSRPNTAPGNIQRPVRLKPLNSNSATTSLRRTSPRYRLRERDSSNDTDQPLSYLLDKDTMRQTAMTAFSSAISPYRLPVINNYVTPVPPLTKKRDRGTRTNGTHRGRKLRPTTAPTEPPTALQRTSVQNKVSVNMVYFGKSVHLSHDQMDLRDEVKVYQQHCGGENLCVFKGRLIEGETFQLVSRRHQGFPFSLTFFLNGLQVERLSSCCEFKHRKGSRLGGRHGHFGFCSVEGASPCYKCIIAMGLDKKPTPPVRRVKEEPPASKSPDEKETTDVDEDVETRSNTEPCASQERENDHNGDTEEQKKHYEEDFEADDEGPVEDGENVEENQKEKSSITNDGVKETESMDEHDQSENNKDSDSEIEDDKVKRSPSVSSGRTSSLSSIDNSEREIEEDTKDDTVVVPDETFNVQPEEDLTTAKMEESSSVTLPQASEEDSETQDKSEKEMSEEHVEGEEAREEAKPDDNPEEPETERATSIQEKLAEAILKESQTCSEPELSDTSTEEDEGASVKTQQDSQGAEVESVVGFASPQPPNPLEDISEENKANTHEDEFMETSHDDDKTGQPESVDTNTETPNTPKDDEESQSMKNEEVPANLDEKQEVEVSETTNEAERQDKQEDAQTKEEESHDETLNNGNIDHKDITEIESPLPEKAEEPMIEKDGLLSNTENNKKTGDTEKKADDADHSNERPDRDERDDLTDEAGLAEEKVQETGGVTDDAGSVYKLEDVENPSEEKVNSAVEDMKDRVPIEEDDKVDVEEVTEKVEGEDESKDHEVEVAGKANEEEKENEGAKDLNKENEDEKNGENESGQAENTENKDQDMTETETEEEKLDVQELSQKEEPEDSLNDDIVEEIEKVNNEMMREQERNENEVEEGIRVEMAEREGENVTKDLKHEDEEEKKEEEHINKIGDGENDENKEAISGENVTQKPEDIEQNGGLVLQGEQNETPDDDNELQEVNKDLPAGNIDAENGERQEDDRNVENHLQDETQDKPEEETVGQVQNVTDDETKSENDEDVREEKDVEVSSEKVVDDKSMMEEVDKESETSARTFIENKVPEETLEETTNKSPVGEDTTDEHNDIETEPKATDNDMSDFPEESKPEEPLENKSIEEDGRPTSHSVKSQPVENIFKKKERTLSIDSEETRSAVSDKANGVDLVSNWINVHQASRYFQTFIEPLDEIKESSISDETEKDQNSEVLDANDTQSTDETATQVQSENNDSTGHDTIVENLTENKPEDLEDNTSQEDKAKESGENKESLVTKSSGQSHEDDEMDRREHSTVHDVTNQTDKTEVQDLASDLNANSQEETEPNRQQSPIEEMIQWETIGKEIQDSSNHNLKSEPEPLSEYIEPQSPTITVITDLMVIHKPENGSQDDTASVDVHSRESDGNRRTNVIDTHFKQSDGNDTLSTFSLDDSRFFGPAGYPRLTTAHTENSY